jgi:Zn-dependent peptidase ImmA (M78 family)
MTWRQKYQRALAAELLCPIGALKAYLNGNTSPTGVDLAARDFGVPIEIVEAVLAYNGILSSRVRFGEPKTGFPYCQGRFASEYAWLPGGKGVSTLK